MTCSRAKGLAGKGTCLAAALVVFHPLAFATNATAAFEAANRYTVKISTRITTPFLGEEKGAFLGAGFLIDKKRGWILTNAHVASRSPSILQVAFKGGEKEKAKKVYVDPIIDVAVIKVDPRSISKSATNATLGCDDKDPAMGASVGVFGHPWGLEYTATRGVVSGTVYLHGTELMQTDAPINLGNSGGPVLSIENGHVIGIATSLLSGADSQSIGFATPIKLACQIVSLLQEGRDPSPPQMPVAFFESDDQHSPLKVAAILGGVSVGLRVDDEIVGVGSYNAAVTHLAKLSQLIRGHNSTDPVKLKVHRHGAVQKVDVRFKPMDRVLNRVAINLSGMMLEEKEINGLDGRIKRVLMVSSIEKGSPASLTDLDPFDLLMTVNGKKVTNPIHLYKILSDAKVDKNKTVHLIFQRIKLEVANHALYFEYDFPLDEFSPVAHQEFAGQH